MLESKNKFSQFFNQPKSILGVVHIAALPGTPNHKYPPKEIVEIAVKEALIYKNAGIDGIIIENMHDVPYLKRNVGPEITSIMAIAAHEIKNKTNLPCGIQILAGANKDAIAAAYSAGLDFIRAEGFVFGHLADEGFIQSDAGDLLRFRKQIGADNILVLTDIKKKHSSHSVTSDISLLETAKAAQFFCSDGLIISGSATGSAPLIQDFNELESNIELPILIGSGITDKNLKDYINYADSFIVGTFFKEKHSWKNTVDKSNVLLLMKERDFLQKSI